MRLLPQTSFYPRQNGSGRTKYAFLLVGSATLGLLLLVTSTILNAHAQTSREALKEQALKAVTEHIRGRQACFAYYNYGSVEVMLPAEASFSVPAGTSFQIKGKLKNTNDFVLPDVRLLARVYQKVPAWEEQNWHAEIVTEDVPLSSPILKPGAEQEFIYSFRAPAQAAAGEYFVEFYVQVAKRFSFNGLPFVPAMAAARVPFTITNPRPGVVAQWQRDEVKFNGKRITLRSVPPAVKPGEQVTISAPLSLVKASAPLNGEVQISLYNWSAADGAAPLLQKKERLQLAPASKRKITFALPESAVGMGAGVYELVFAFLPHNKEIPPSRLPVRFAVQPGHAPRLIFAGVVDRDDHEILISTCLVNGVMGEGKGKVTLVVSQGDKVLPGVIVTERNELLGKRTVEVGPEMTGLFMRVPAAPSDSLRNLSVKVIARNEKGEIADQHEIIYPSLPLPLREVATNWRGWLLVVVIGGIICGVVLILVMKWKYG
jgi:hypothetical protein